MSASAYPTTVEAARPALRAFLDVNTNKLGNLYGRWLDEKEYEDFADYAAVLKTIAETDPAFAFVKASKRPFGFVVEHRGLNRKLQFSVTTRAVNIKFV